MTVDPTLRRLAAQLGDLLDDEMTRRLPSLAEDAPQDLLVVLGMRAAFDAACLAQEIAVISEAAELVEVAQGNLLARYEAKA